MQYVLLLRGVNVGGRNKVEMSVLKDQLTQLGYEKVISYINSGNILFDSSKSYQQIQTEIQGLLQENYDFKILFSLFSAEDLLHEVKNLPKWWDQELGRKDILFFTNEGNSQTIKETINQFDLYNEVVHFGELAIFWGQYSETEFLKTAYHKQLIKEKCYKQVTIRNDKTFQKILSLIEVN